MRDDLREITVYMPLAGFDAEVRVEFEVTSWGSPAVIDYVFGGDPAEPPEWTVTDIGVTLDLDDGPGSEWEPDGAAFRSIANCTRVEDAIIKDIQSIDRPRRRGRRSAFAEGWL